MNIMDLTIAKWPIIICEYGYMYATVSSINKEIDLMTWSRQSCHVPAALLQYSINEHCPLVAALKLKIEVNSTKPSEGKVDYRKRTGQNTLRQYMSLLTITALSMCHSKNRA